MVDVHIVHPRDRAIAMEPLDGDYFSAVVDEIAPGARYLYCLDGRTERPDPASRFQPQGVHGPSEVVDTVFAWTDNGWTGTPLEQYVLYQLHVGTFTPQGTFDTILPRISELRDLGITAIELMPVAQFPGNRNWGYDGVNPYAVQNSYGGPAALKRLVNTCHEQGLAVVLDVVYNHLGPEGNYLADFGPYLADSYRTPWGQAVNFDGPQSDNVRCYFIENALQWITEFHVDALRLDAIHAIVDLSARPFLQELSSSVHAKAKQLNRKIFLIAESNRNDARVVSPRDAGGLELDGVWNDDFHIRYTCCSPASKMHTIRTFRVLKTWPARFGKGLYTRDSIRNTGKGVTGALRNRLHPIASWCVHRITIRWETAKRVIV